MPVATKEPWQERRDASPAGRTGRRFRLPGGCPIGGIYPESYPITAAPKPWGPVLTQESRKQWLEATGRLRSSWPISGVLGSRRESCREEKGQVKKMNHRELSLAFPFGRSRARLLCCSIIYAARLYAAQSSAKGVEFSAEFSTIEDGTVYWQKAYFAEEKVRVEVSGGGATVIDLRKETGYFISKGSRTEWPLGERRIFELRLGGPLQDSENPCAQLLSWFLPDNGQERRMITTSCTWGSGAIVNGRQTQSCVLTIAGEEKKQDGRIERGIWRLIAWVDPVLKHTIRLDGFQGGDEKNLRPIYEPHSWAVQELRNIKVGPQPASLFDISTEPSENRRRRR